MENLNSIPNIGKWNKIAELLNSNLQKIEQELISLGYSTYRNKGYFSSEDALKSVVSVPKSGDWAVVDGYIYIEKDGSWSNTNDIFSTVVNLNEYVLKGSDISANTINDIELQDIILGINENAENQGENIETIQNTLDGKIDKNNVLPFDGVVENANILSGGTVAEKFAIYYVKSKDCFAAYANTTFNSMWFNGLQNVADLYNKDGYAIKNNLYIDPDGNIYKFNDDNELIKVYSAEEKYTTLGKVNSVIKELYLYNQDGMPINDVSNYYVAVILRKYYDQNNDLIKCQITIRDEANSDSDVCEYYDTIEDVDHEPDTLVTLKDRKNISGIYGYAVIDWNNVTSGYLWYTISNEPRAYLTNKVTELELSPTIYSLLNKSGVESTGSFDVEKILKIDGIVDNATIQPIGYGGDDFDIVYVKSADAFAARNGFTYYNIWGIEGTPTYYELYNDNEVARKDIVLIDGFGNHYAFYNNVLTKVTDTDDITNVIDDKQDALTLTVKDNGNIVIGNIQGQTKEFMPATPSGDPNHYMYEKCGAVWNGDTGYWELNGLTDMTNEDMQDSYLKCNMYYNRIVKQSEYQNRLFRTNFYLDVGDVSASMTGVVMANSFNGCYKTEILNFGTSYNIIGNCINAFSGCKLLKEIQGILKFNKNTTTTNIVYNCKLLSIFQFNNVATNIELYYQKNEDTLQQFKESLLYLINNASSTVTFEIKLAEDVYEWAKQDADINTALTNKTITITS